MSEILDCVRSVTEPPRHSLWIDSVNRTIKCYGAGGWQSLGGSGGDGQGTYNIESIPDSDINTICQ